MKNTILIITIITLSFFNKDLTAQVNTTYWGEEIIHNKGEYYKYFVGYDENNFYVIQQVNEGLLNLKFYLLSYDYNFNMIAKDELNPEKTNEKINVEFFLNINNKSYLFYSYINMDNNNASLYAQEINEDLSNLFNDEFKLAEEKFESKLIYYTLQRSFYGERQYSQEKRVPGFFQYRLSEDNSKLLIYKTSSLNENASSMYNFFVFDNSLELLWQDSVSLGHDKTLYRGLDVEIDNNGKIHILGRVKTNRDFSKEKGKPTYYYELATYSYENDKLITSIIEFGNKFLSDAKIVINNNEETIICAGFYSDIHHSKTDIYMSSVENLIHKIYSERNLFGKIGTFFTKRSIDDHNIIAEKHEEFNLDILTLNRKARKKEKIKKKYNKGKDVELYDFDLNYIIPKKDGGVIILAEQLIIEKKIDNMNYSNLNNTHNNYNGHPQLTHPYMNKTKTKTSYEYNDILIFNFSPNGEIIWCDRLPKRQRQSSSYHGGAFVSYFLATSDDELSIFYNDNRNNIDYNGEGNVAYLNYYLKSIITIVQYDKNGIKTKDFIEPKNEEKIMIQPPFCFQNSKKKVVILTTFNKGHQFVDVELN